LHPREKIVSRPSWPISMRAAVVIAVIGALAPDLDMLFFYLVDDR